MQLNHDTILSLSFVYEQAKFWLPAITAAYAIFRAWNWVKAIRETDLTTITSSVKNTNAAVEKLEASMSAHLQAQTVSIVDQLKELRSDFRTFYTIPQPQMVPARSRKPATKRKQKAKSNKNKA